MVCGDIGKGNVRTSQANSVPSVLIQYNMLSFRCHANLKRGLNGGNVEGEPIEICHKATLQAFPSWQYPIGNRAEDGNDGAVIYTGVAALGPRLRKNSISRVCLWRGCR